MTAIGPYTVSVDDGLVHVSGLDEATTVARAVTPDEARALARVVRKWGASSDDPETELRLYKALIDAATEAEQVRS